MRVESQDPAAPSRPLSTASQLSTSTSISARSLADSCRYGVVFALSIESGCLEDLLQGAATTRGHGFRVRCGELDGRQVAIVQSGPGRERAARATHALIDGHRPGVVISAGFAGALEATLRRGDIVAADCFVDEAGRELTADRALLSAAERRGARVGRLLTVDRVIRSSEEKLALGRKHAALAADMETLAVAEVCRDRQQPFLALRVINDAADDALPDDVRAALGADRRRPSPWGRPWPDLEASFHVRRSLAASAAGHRGFRPLGDVPCRTDAGQRFQAPDSFLRRNSARGVLSTQSPNSENLPCLKSTFGTGSPLWAW